ncbi:MAG: restriction endonuclease [Anaerolineae bacterium]|nr:restriction endonuclease [Anaerolineae bacterium]
MMNDEYTKRLENVIKQMLIPLKGIPLNLVIEAISNHKILPFDPTDAKDVTVLNNLVKVCEIAGREINTTGIRRTRPNEVGNDIEPFVRDALRTIGYRADAPKTKSGSKKATGYPDLEFVDEFGRVNYLECKTFNIENINTTQRSFYLSPSEDFKITQDAHHFVISFEIYVAGRQGRENIYKCKSWKVLSVETLPVDVKYEFNSDNARLYARDLILAEGQL